MGYIGTAALMLYLAAIIGGLYSIAPRHVKENIKDYIQSIQNK